MKYAVVTEKGENSFGAYVPDLPGCVTAAETKDEVRKLIREAIALHLESLKEVGSSFPAPKTTVEEIEA